MTVEDKRQAIEGYCKYMDCERCPLEKINRGLYDCDKDPSDKVINRYYEVLFGHISEEWLEVDPGNPWESKEQNVPAEPKITLRELLDIMEVSLVISEKYFDNVLVILKTDEYTPETYTSILAPEFLDREVYRMKTQDNNILVALKEVE